MKQNYIYMTKYYLRHLKHIINFIQYNIIYIKRADLVGKSVTTPKTPLDYATDTSASSNTDNFGSASLLVNRAYSIVLPRQWFLDDLEFWYIGMKRIFDYHSPQC